MKILEKHFKLWRAYLRKESLISESDKLVIHFNQNSLSVYLNSVEIVAIDYEDKDVNEILKEWINFENAFTEQLKRGDR